LFLAAIEISPFHFKWFIAERTQEGNGTTFPAGVATSVLGNPIIVAIERAKPILSFLEELPTEFTSAFLRSIHLVSPLELIP